MNTILPFNTELKKKLTQNAKHRKEVIELNDRRSITYLFV